MWQLAAACLEVTFRRRGPETLPDSIFLMLFLLGIDIVLNLAGELPLTGLGWHELVLFFGSYALTLGFIFAVLSFFKLERRYLQTMSALIAVDICLTLFYYLFLFPGLALHLETKSMFLQSLGLGLLFYQIFVSGWVLARSISQPLITGLMFEILLTVIQFIMRPLPPPAAS